jgi:hypothetical protein
MAMAAGPRAVNPHELDRKRFAAIRTALVIADEEREIVKQHASAA